MPEKKIKLGGGWNYRIMRKVQHDPKFGTSVTYGIVEAHYEKRGDELPNTWTEEYVEPMAENLPDLIKDFAWMMTALTKPVLDHNGSACEPATILVDELQQWLDARADAQGEA